MATKEEIAQIFPTMCERFLPDKAQGVDGYIQFDLTGDSGGLYWLNVTGGTCTWGEGQAENPKMTLRAVAEDYMSVISGSTNAMTAFMSGKIKIQGDMGLAMKMQTMFATS